MLQINFARLCPGRANVQYMS